MRLSLFALIALTACSTEAPADLVRINSSVNDRATYQQYAKRDFRYLRTGGSGNCAAFAYAKYVDLLAAGYKPLINTER